MKKIIAILAVVSLILGIFAACSNEDKKVDGLEGVKVVSDVIEEGDYQYVELSNDTVKIVKYIGADYDTVTIPEKLGEMPVSVIGEQAFTSNKTISIPVIPETVVSIEKYAFSDCAITKVTIPEGVTYIGDFAFSYCTSLVWAKVSNSVEHIGIGAFQMCSSLKSLVILDDVAEIGDKAFDVGITSSLDGGFAITTTKLCKNLLKYCYDNGVACDYQQQ